MKRKAPEDFPYIGEQDHLERGEGGGEKGWFSIALPLTLWREAVHAASHHGDDKLVREVLGRVLLGDGLERVEWKFAPMEEKELTSSPSMNSSIPQKSVESLRPPPPQLYDSAITNTARTAGRGYMPPLPPSSLSSSSSTASTAAAELEQMAALLRDCGKGTNSSYMSTLSKAALEQELVDRRLAASSALEHGRNIGAIRRPYQQPDIHLNDNHNNSSSISSLLRHQHAAAAAALTSASTSSVPQRGSNSFEYSRLARAFPAPAPSVYNSYLQQQRQQQGEQQQQPYEKPPSSSIRPLPLQSTVTQQQQGWPLYSRLGLREGQELSAGGKGDMTSAASGMLAMSQTRPATLPLSSSSSLLSSSSHAHINTEQDKGEKDERGVSSLLKSLQESLRQQQNQQQPSNNVYDNSTNTSTTTSATTSRRSNPPFMMNYTTTNNKTATTTKRGRPPKAATPATVSTAAMNREAPPSLSLERAIGTPIVSQSGRKTFAVTRGLASSTAAMEHASLKANIAQTSIFPDAAAPVIDDEDQKMVVRQPPINTSLLSFEIDKATYILPGGNLKPRANRACRVEKCCNRYRSPGYFCEAHGGGKCQALGCSRLHQGRQGLRRFFFCRNHRKMYGHRPSPPPPPSPTSLAAAAVQAQPSTGMMMSTSLSCYEEGEGEEEDHEEGKVEEVEEEEQGEQRQNYAKVMSTITSRVAALRQSSSTAAYLTAGVNNMPPPPFASTTAASKAPAPTAAGDVNGSTVAVLAEAAARNNQKTSLSSLISSYSAATAALSTALTALKPALLMTSSTDEAAEGQRKGPKETHVTAGTTAGTAAASISNSNDTGKDAAEKERNAAAASSSFCDSGSYQFPAVAATNIALASVSTNNSKNGSSGSRSMEGLIIHYI